MNGNDQQQYFPATTMPDSQWWTELWPDPAQVLKDVGIGEGMSVVDLCCGDGLFTAALSKIVGEQGSVCALDLSSEMLSKAKACVAKDGNPVVCQWVEGPAESFSAFVPPHSDAVLMANTFHGVPDKMGLAREAAVALDDGGMFIVINWNNRPREETTVQGMPRGPKTEMRLSAQQVASLVTPAGFRIAKLVNLPPYHYGAVFRRTTMSF
jgi:ubiquinone/menaquinone biosynthesis C-methylase UbiE